MSDKPKIEKMIEPDSGIVHLMNISACNGEYTICGISWDFPATEQGMTAMKNVDADTPITCPQCLADARMMKDYLTRALRKQPKREKSIKEHESFLIRDEKNIGLNLVAIKDEDELDEKFAAAYGLNTGNEWWYEGYEDELQWYHDEWCRLHSAKQDKEGE